MHRFLRQLALAAAGALLLLAVAVGPSIAVDRWVTMYDSQYLPGVVTINVGERVTWVNDDDLPHDATGNGWATPLLNKYDSYAIRFTRAGRYNYICSIHPQMQSAVIVRGAGGGGSTPPSDVASEPSTNAGLAWGPIGIGFLVAVVVGFGLVAGRPARPRT